MASQFVATRDWFTKLGFARDPANQDRITYHDQPMREGDTITLGTSDEEREALLRELCEAQGDILPLGVTTRLTVTLRNDSFVVESDHEGYDWVKAAQEEAARYGE